MKFLKPMLAIILSCILLCGCEAKNDTEYDEAWIEGIEFGQREVFENLWHSATLDDILCYGDTWETEHFSLKLTNGVRKTTVISAYSETEPYIEFDLTLKDKTITDCNNNMEMLFNIYSHNGKSWSPVLRQDDYFSYALLYELNENSCSAEVRIYEDTEALGIIIVIDGYIYKADYELYV